MEWTKLIKDKYDTYPKEGIEVLVSDGKSYDVAWYLMSGEYRWVKNDLVKDSLLDFIKMDLY